MRNSYFLLETWDVIGSVVNNNARIRFKWWDVREVPRGHNIDFYSNLDIIYSAFPRLADIQGGLSHIFFFFNNRYI